MKIKFLIGISQIYYVVNRFLKNRRDKEIIYAILINLIKFLIIVKQLSKTQEYN